MTHYNFYYDESEHSREINHQTISASNYYDNFVAVFIGWDSSQEEKIKQDYLAFEQQYGERKNKQGELKSETIKNKQFKNGLASTSKDNLKFLEDFLGLFDENVMIQYSIISKIEYIILQMLESYGESSAINLPSLCYSVTKLLLQYRPKSVLKSIYYNINAFPTLFLDFCKERLKANDANLELKQRENKTLRELIVLFQDIEEDFQINWNYDIVFRGFKKYLLEIKIDDYLLILDKEGEEGEASRTLKAAQSVGLKNLQELMSEDQFGIRMADMLAGVISKFMKALNTELRYKNQADGTQKKLLSLAWFNVNDRQLQLYKKLYYVVSELNKAWYKVYSNYSDDLITFLGFLDYMNHFTSVKEIKGPDYKLIPEYCNACICERLAQHFLRMNPGQQYDLNLKLVDDRKDYFFNKEGAESYFDTRK